MMASLPLIRGPGKGLRGDVRNLPPRTASCLYRPQGVFDEVVDWNEVVPRDGSVIGNPAPHWCSHQGPRRPNAPAVRLYLLTSPRADRSSRRPPRRIRLDRL